MNLLPGVALGPKLCFVLCCFVYFSDSANTPKREQYWSTMAQFELFYSETVSLQGLALKPIKDTFNSNDIKLATNFCES